MGHSTGGIQPSEICQHNGIVKRQTAESLEVAAQKTVFCYPDLGLTEAKIKCHDRKLFIKV